MNEECHHKHNPTQKPGMSKKDFTEKIAGQMEKLTDLNILLKNETEKDENGYHHYKVNPEFIECRDDHFRLQNETEYENRKKGIKIEDEFGGMNRDDYVTGIAIQDYVNPSPMGKGCQECRAIVFKYEKLNGSNGSRECYNEQMEHTKKDHKEYWDYQGKIIEDVNEWSVLISEMIRLSQKEWRSR